MENVIFIVLGLLFLVALSGGSGAEHDPTIGTSPNEKEPENE